MTSQVAKQQSLRPKTGGRGRTKERMLLEWLAEQRLPVKTTSSAVAEQVGMAPKQVAQLLRGLSGYHVEFGKQTYLGVDVPATRSVLIS